MLIDFKEIPVGKKLTESLDDFEKFARDFLIASGFEIITDPTRGADGGLDIKALEKRKGNFGTTDFYWLVSCKHYANSGKAVGISDEIDIVDRMNSNQCNGFMGFYSSIASSGLLKKLESLRGDFEFLLFDNEKIENGIVAISSMENIFLRYFPQSYIRWKELYFYYEPVNLVNYYLETKYKSDKYHLETIFGSTGNFIKSLRKNDKFELAVINENFIIIIENIDFKWYWEQKGVIHDVLSKTINIDYTHGDDKLISVSSNIKIGGGILIIYDKYLIINEPYLIFFENLYYDLRNMIK